MHMKKGSGLPTSTTSSAQDQHPDLRLDALATGPTQGRDEEEEVVVEVEDEEELLDCDHVSVFPVLRPPHFDSRQHLAKH